MVPQEKNIDKITLAGLALPSKTTNENGQSNIDCGKLWEKFEMESYFKKIPGKLTDEVLAVYHDYDGDHTDPFAYFIGCKVDSSSTIPDELDTLTIPAGNYQKVVVKGKMPDCISKAWKEIWESDMNRAYQADFEVYDERSRDWSNAEIDIFVSVA